MILTQSGDELTVKLGERLDSGNVAEAEAALKEVLPWKGTVVWDLEKLEYISSAGLRVMLACQKQMKGNGNMVILHTNDSVMNIFKMTGMAMIFDFQ